MMVLGSSGSGKTVLSKVVVEECVLAGTPVIAIDPQGDLCSLALEAEDKGPFTEDDSLVARTSSGFAEKADAVIFAPASRCAVPLCACR